MANNYTYYWQKSEPKIETPKIEPFKAPEWKFQWQDRYAYDDKDPLDLERKRRGIPPKSFLSLYNLDDEEDKKRFYAGERSKTMLNEQVKSDIDLYQKERQRLFEQALARKQAEADKKWDWFGLAPKKVEYIDPEEYAPAMPESLSAWQGYLDKMADYNQTLDDMDPDEKAYRRAIGNLPKPPDKPGFDLEQFVKWEDLQRDLWEEYLDKQAKQEVQPTVAPTVAPTNTPTGNVQKGAQQLYPMWKPQGGPTSPVPTPTPTVMPTPTPTVQPIGTPMPTYTPTREPATFGEFQRLQEQQRQEAERQSQWKGYNRPVGGTVGTQPDIPSRSPFASGSREALYKAGESKGFGDFQKLQNDMEQERQQSGDPFTAKDILPFIRRLSNVAAHTVSGGNASVFINLESWAKRMEQIVDELDTTTDAERYDELVSEYNTLLERYQNEYQAIDTGNEKANKIADTIGSLIGIGTPIPGAGFTKLEPFRPIGSAVSERVGRPISNLLTKAAEKGASDAAIRGLYFAYQTIPAGVGSAVQFSAMQAMTNVIDPNYEDLSTKEKLEAVGNSALWGLILGSGSAAIKEAVRVGTSYAKPFVINKINPKIRSTFNKPWINKLLEDKKIAEIRVDKNGNLDPNGDKTGVYIVKENVTEQIKIPVDGTNIYTLKDNVTEQIKIQVDGTNTLNVAPRAAWLRAMINEAGETAKEGAKETAKEAVTMGLIGSGGGTPKAKQTKAPAVSIPVGSKVTLKGLGEVEVLSETATHVKIRRANGKELDVLKTAFSKGLDKATKKEVSTKTNIQDQFKLTERGQKQLDELLDNPYVDIKQISAPKVDLADGEVLLYRRDRNDRVITNDKAQGLYTTPVYDGNAYTAHEDVGDKDIFIKAKIDNMLTVPPMVERTHRHEKIELSAGAGALKMLDEAEFNKLNSMSKDKAMAYVKQKYPNLNIDNYGYDAYELMEVVGAEKARQHGYDAIYANNEMDPSLNEVVLLTNNFEIIDNAPLKTPTSPVEASKQQDIQTQEEEAKTQPEAEIEATSRVVDDSQYGRSGKLAFNKLIKDRGIDIESPEGQRFVTKFNEYYNAAMSGKARPNFADESDLELATFAYNAGEGDRTEVRAGSKAQATTEPITETDIVDSKIPTPEDTSSSIVQVDPKDIKVDTKRFQFKLDVDPKTGAGKGLDIEKWDEYLAGTVLVWEANNGDRYIVNGHHRLAKAKELGVDRINAMIVRETDGISDVDAKLLGAKINIAEGHGSITDAAKLFRDGGYTLEQLKAEGLPMKSGNAQKGYAIAQLTDNLFNKVVDKVITENQGAIIGEKIPSDGGINDARQEFILKQLMNKDMTNRVLEETLDAIKSVEASSHTQQTLFGEELVWDVADFEIKPKVIAETKRIISSDKNAFSKIVRNAESLKRVGNVLQDDANVEQKNTLEQALELIDRMKYAKGDEIAGIFNKATSHVQAGGSIKDAGEKAAKEIIDLISEGEYLKGLMGKLPKAETVETDTIPGQTSLFGEEPAQAEQTPITEPTKGGETSGEAGISQSEDSKDSPKVPRRTEADAKADAGRNLETEEGKPEVAQAEKPATEPKPQSTGALSDYDLTIQKSTTKNGNPVWELKGVKKDDTDMINVMRKFRARWYGPKKVWSFYQEEDPTPKILAEIEKVRPKNQGTKSAQEAKAAEPATKEPATVKADTEDKYMGFKEGDKVSFVSKNGETLTGRITSLSDYSSISPDIGVAATVNIDQIKSAGGVPIYRKEVVSLKKLTKVEEAPTDTNSQNQGINSLEDNATTRDFDDWVVRFVILDSANWLKDAVINTDKETLMPEIIKRVKDGVTEKLTSYQKSIPKEVASWYDSRMANDGNNKYIKGMAEDIYNETKGGTSDVSNKGQTEKGASPEPSETQAGGMGGIRSNQHKGTQSGVSETKPEQGSVSDVAGEPTERSGSSVDTGVGPSGEDNKGAGNRPRKDADGKKGSTGSGGSDTDGVPSRPGKDAGSDSEGSGNVSTDLKHTNYVITGNEDVFTKGGKKTRYQANIKAMNLLLNLLEEGRLATKEEQAVLAQFSGFGALPEVFDYTSDYDRYTRKYTTKVKHKEWEKEFNETKELVDKLAIALGVEKDGYYGLYEMLRKSTGNAHYTSPEVIKSMYKIAKRLGFKGGNVLEPSMGIGNFFGLIPNELKNSSKLYGVELEPITGHIAKMLYPNSNIQVSGFEKTNFPNNFFDMAIGNVPFGDIRIFDDSVKDERLKSQIHNYFFVKTLDKVKPGGVVLFITSTGTMDSSNTYVRNYIANKANLLGAIRLPNDAFKSNAGTSVTTDILILQKLREGELPNGLDWIETTDQTVEGSTYPLNNYYVNNPDMMLGELSIDTLYGSGGRLALQATDGDIADKIINAIDNLPEGILSPFTTPGPKTAAVIQDTDETVRIGTVYEKDGTVYKKTDKGDSELPAGQQDIAKRLMKLSDAARNLIDKQATLDVSDSELEADRKALKRLYDSYVKKYGKIFEPQGTMKNSYAKNIFANDPRYQFMQSLEVAIEDKKGKITSRPSDILTKRTFIPYKPVEKVSSAQDGLIASLHDLGRLDISHISKIYGKPENEVIEELGDAIFHNPSGDWETSDEYLSGNVRKKLKEAMEASKYDSMYYRNVEELRKVIPDDKAIADVHIQIGQSWIPLDVTHSVIAKLLGVNRSAIDLKYNPIDSKWSLTRSKGFSDNAQMRQYEVGSKDALQVFRDALNMSEGKYTYKDSEGKTHIDEEFTYALQSKIRQISEDFKEAILNDSKISQVVQDAYNETANAIASRDFTQLGQMLELPGLNPEIKEKLYDHQRTGVARAIFRGNTMFAHAVGSGKTWTEIISIMEYRRLGLANKPVLVVPSNKIGDYVEDFAKLYPHAKVLALSEEDFSPKNVIASLARAATNDWDCVIIRHDSFTKVPVSSRVQIDYIRRQLHEAETIYAEEKGDRINIKNLTKMIENLRVKLEKATSGDNKYDSLAFDTIGFDLLVIDEAHFYKNLQLPGRTMQVKGMQIRNADKAMDLAMKTSYLHNLHNGKRGVIFGTGTPISNSMAEVYIMMRYLDPNLLNNSGLRHIDEFARTHADIYSELEIAGSGEFKPITRFQGFKNLSELFTIFREVVDIKLPNDLDLPVPKLEGGKAIVVKCPPAPQLKEIMAEVASKWDIASKDGSVLKYFNWMRYSPIDVRFVDASYPDWPTSKINTTVKNVIKVYKETAKEKGTQIIFLNRGRSTISNIDLYEELVEKLVKAGIPRNEIALTTAKRQMKDSVLKKLYRKANTGEIRVLIGSMDKLGTGVNVQQRLFALHEIDVPFKPSQLEQAEGRMLRAGNSYYGKKPVRIYRYVTQGQDETFSGDAYNWQLIEQKRRNINAAMSGDKSITYIDEDADDAALLKAIALGDPLYLEKIKLENTLKRMTAERNTFLRNKTNARSYSEWSRRMLDTVKSWIRYYLNYDKKIVDSNPGDTLSVVVGNKTYDKREAANKAIEKAMEKSDLVLTEGKKRTIGNFRGFDIVAAFEGHRVFGGNRVHYYLQNPKLSYGNAYYVSLRDSKDYVAVMNNTVNGLEKAYAEHVSEVEKLNKDIELYEESMNATFPKEEEYTDIRNKIKDIDMQLGIGRVSVSQNEEGAEELTEKDQVKPKKTRSRASSGTQSRTAAAPSTDSDDSDGDTGIVQRPMPSRKNATGVQARTKSKDSSGVQAKTPSVASTVTSSFFATVTKPISRTELVDFISEYLDIPIKQGKFRERALGIFKEHPEIIRLKDGKDLDTLFHEMGHYFDKRLGLMDEKYLGELYELGIPASKDSYNEKQVMGEGIAEFVRIFTVDPAEAKALAPEFYKDFMKKIALSPGMKDFFDTVKTATINYINQDFENRILGNISVGPNKKKAAFLSRDTLDRIYTAAFDNLHPLKRAVDIITGGEKIDAKDNPFIRAWLYRGVSGKVEAILKYGPIDKNGNKIGKSFEEILSKVDKNSLNDFRAYIVSKHAKELMDEGIATGLSEADVNLTIKKYDNQFEPILKELVEFQRNVLKQLVDAGILSADSYNKITKYEYYVPFNRVMDDTKTSGTGKGLEARNPVYGIKGSSRDIIDPLESIIKNTFIYTNMADRNMIGKAFVDLARKYEGSGKIIDKVPPRMIPQTVMLKELEKVLSSAGADTTEINLDQIATVFRPRGYTNKDNVITVFENGKPTYYEVIDEDLYNAFKSLDQEQTPFYVKILSIPAQVLRAGATGLNVDFFGRNIARDTIFAGISSKYWFIPFVDSIKGLAHVLKKDEIFQSFLYSGGGDSELVSTDRSRIQRYQRNLLQQSGELNVLNIVRHPMDFIRLLGEYSELATRVGVHGKALKKEGDSVSGRMLAGLASRETTVDFARMGTNVGNINKAIAFFNSALQGGDVLVRAAMRDKGKFALRAIMYITLPSILTYLLNRDDDEYEEIPQYQKDTFWLFKIGGQWWRIPKPFEMGMMFGSLVERFLAYTDKEDPHALDGWAEQLKDSALPDIIPTALLPLIEVWTNHDMFRNIPVIPQGDEYKKPADQYGPYTSSLAKTLGKVFNYSPYKIDHLIKGYGAGVGQNISNIASKGLELTGIAEKKTEPDKPLSQKLPIIRGLTVDPQRSSKSVSDFYDRLNELEDDYKQMRDSDGIELNQYPKRKELRAMRKAQIELRDLNREYKEVYADNKMDAKTKREKLSKINLERINVARKALGKPKIRE